MRRRTTNVCYHPSSSSSSSSSSSPAASKKGILRYYENRNAVKDDDNIASTTSTNSPAIPMQRRSMSLCATGAANTDPSSSSCTPCAASGEAVGSYRTGRPAINVYTDGSCIHNGKKHAIGGIGVYFGPDDARNISQRVQRGKITNQTMELEACLRAIELACATARPRYSSDASTPSPPVLPVVTIYTDSEYVVKSMNTWAKDWERKGWKTRFGGDVSNLALVQRLYALKRALGVRFVHVPAHRSEPPCPGCPEHAHWKGNYYADQMATRATARSNVSSDR